MDGLPGLCHYIMREGKSMQDTKKVDRLPASDTNLASFLLGNVSSLLIWNK
jgi:hypothetical protein